MSFGWVSNKIQQEQELTTWVLIINYFGISYVLNVCVCCPVISAQW